MRCARDGQDWRTGGDAEVAWIVAGTAIGLEVTSAVPPIFEAYATIVVPGERALRDEHDRAVLAALSEQSSDQPWWLGYLDTGADDVVFPDAPMVTMYAGWRYVLAEAGPLQAATWKDSSSWRGALPDVIFPADRSWLLSTLWDDEWRCIGGPGALIDRLHRDDRLQVRTVNIGEDATPPGYQAR
jgi:hypothetical protein